MPVAVEPVVVVVRLKGDSQGLLNTLDDLRRGQTAAGPTPGLIIHTVSPTDDGVLIVDVWESETHYWAFLAGSKERRGAHIMSCRALRFRSIVSNRCFTRGAAPCRRVARIRARMT